MPSGRGSTPCRRACATIHERGLSLLLLLREAALDDALGGQLRHRGPHPDHVDGDSTPRQVTEGRYKSAVKTKARKTNNQASFGGSLLQNNLEVEAAIEMARHLDETGSCRLRCRFAKHLQVS